MTLFKKDIVQVVNVLQYFTTNGDNYYLPFTKYAPIVWLRYVLESVVLCVNSGSTKMLSILYVMINSLNLNVAFIHIEFI